MAVQYSSESIKLIIFNLATEEFGIEITKINSIIRLQTITKIPYAAEFVEGIIDFRGKPLVVIDLRKRFNLPERNEKLDEMRIIVLDFHPFLLGMIVDNVTEVFSLPFNVIEPVPENLISLDIEQEYLLGVGNLNSGERLIILLDLLKIFSDNELEQLGIIFSEEQKIRLYIENNKTDRVKIEEEIRRSISQSAFDEEKLKIQGISDGSQGEKQKYLEMENAMIQKIALRELQEEMGIKISNTDETTQIKINIEEGESFEKEDGVEYEYVYVDENGNEIETPIEESSESTPQIADNKISELIAAAEMDNKASLQEKMSDLDLDNNRSISNSDVADIIAAIETRKKAEKVVKRYSEEEVETGTITEEKIRSYEKYLKSITKSKLMEIKKKYSKIKITNKMKKVTLIKNILKYMQENAPEEIINQS